MKECEDRVENAVKDGAPEMDHRGGARGDSAPMANEERGERGESSRKEGTAVRFLTRGRILLLSKGIGLLALAFLMGRCQWFLSAEPFGIALLCAAESGLGWIYGGIVLSTLPIFGGTFQPITVVVATAAVLLRVAARMTLDLPWKRGEEPDVRGFRSFCKVLFREHSALRMAIGSIAAFLTGLYRMIGGRI